jgi:hypothetical protein
MPSVNAQLRRFVIADLAKRDLPSLRTASTFHSCRTARGRG